jgi:hypothetical protein
VSALASFEPSRVSEVLSRCKNLLRPALQILDLPGEELF